jgi:hypothetical protein
MLSFSFRLLCNEVLLDDARKKMLTHGKENRVTAVSVATGYGLEGRGIGIRVPVRARALFSPLL